MSDVDYRAEADHKDQDSEIALLKRTIKSQEELFNGMTFTYFYIGK